MSKNIKKNPVPSDTDKAIKASETKLSDLKDALENIAYSRAFSGAKPVTSADVAGLLKRADLTNAADEVDALVRLAEKATAEGTKARKAQLPGQTTGE